MPSIKDIINEEIMTTVANLPQFGDRLKSISETGDASSTPYPYKFENTGFDEVHYYFSTEKYDYDVILKNSDMYSGVWVMQFGPIGGSVKDVTNEGKPFKIMATLTQITNEFIEKFKPNVLQFVPEKDEERDDDKRRFNLYMQFIKKHMIRDYMVYPYGDHIVIERKIKIKSNIPKI